MSWNKKEWIKRFLFATLTIVSVGFSLIILYRVRSGVFFQQYKVLSFSDFFNYCKKGMVRNVYVHQNHMIVEVMFKKNIKDIKNNSDIEIFKVFIPTQDFAFINDIKEYTNVSFVPVPSNAFAKIIGLIVNLLPFVLMYWYMRKVMNNDTSMDGKEDELNDLNDSVVLLDEVVGFGSIKEEMRDLMRLWFYNSNNTNQKQDYINTILFTGPPGTGKTYMSKVIAKTTRAKFLMIDISQQGSAFIHQTSRNIQKVFDRAREMASQNNMVLIFMDEVDSVLQSRSSMKGSNLGDRESTEVVTTILRNISGIGSKYDHKILLVCATNFDDNLDDAFKSRVSNSYKFGNLPYYDRKEFIEFLTRKEFKDVKWNVDMNLFAKLSFNNSQRKIKNVMLNATSRAKSRFMEVDRKAQEIATVNDEDLFISLISDEKIQNYKVTDEAIMITAMHEGSHLIFMYLMHLYGFSPLTGVAIGITAGKLGGIGGLAFYGIDEYSEIGESEAMIGLRQNKKTILSSILTSVAGRAGELLFESEAKDKFNNNTLQTDASILGWWGDLNSAMDSLECLHLGGVSFRQINDILYEMMNTFNFFQHNIEIEFAEEKHQNCILNSHTTNNELMKTFDKLSGKFIQSIKINGEKINHFLHCDFNFIIDSIMEKRKYQKTKSKQVYYEKILHSTWIITHLIVHKHKDVIKNLAIEASKNLLLSGDKLQGIINNYIV